MDFIHFTFNFRCQKLILLLLSFGTWNAFRLKQKKKKPDCDRCLEIYIRKWLAAEIAHKHITAEVFKYIMISLMP